MDPPRTPSTLRVLDANLNRAAEALRVVEEICRFHWNLEGLAAELKDLRHGVLAALTGTETPRESYFRWRDIEGDVGRDTPSPPAPGTASGDAPLEAAAIRNLQRAKEAIRTLEETSRPLRPGAARLLEKARYRLYSVEKGIGCLRAGSRLKERIAAVRLYLLASSALSSRPIEDVAGEALDAGAGAIQLREKGAPARRILELARKLREVTARRGALLIINDRPDLALLSHADGVHVGQGDVPVAEARSLLGDGRIVGASTHSVQEARRAEREGADYVGVGPVFATATKDAGPALGPRGLETILSGLSVPAFAIGGITAQNAASLGSAGCRRAAVSASILRAPQPAAVVRAILAELPAAT